MKKLMATGAMLAIMVAGASPAFADHLAVGGDVDVEFLNASQSQAAAALQNNEGDADVGNLGGAAAIDQGEVNAGDGGVAAGGTFFVF